MPAPSIVQSTVLEFSSPTSPLTLNWPASTTVGSFLLLHISANGSSPSFTAPAGYGGTSLESNGACYAQVFFNNNATSRSSESLVWTGTVSDLVIELVEVTGQPRLTAQDGSSTTESGDSASLSGSYTTAQANDLLLSFASQVNSGSGSSSPVFSGASSGFSILQQGNTSSGSGTSLNSVAGAVMTATAETVGTYTPSIASNVSSDWITFTFAVKAMPSGWARIQGGTTTFSSSALNPSLTVTLANATGPGDLLVCGLSIEGGAVASISGWSQASENNGTICGAHLLYLINAPRLTSFTITFSGPVPSASIFWQEYSAGDLPVNVDSIGPNNTGSGTSLASASFTIGGNNDLIALVPAQAYSQVGTSSQAPVLSAPTGAFSLTQKQGYVAIISSNSFVSGVGLLDQIGASSFSGTGGVTSSDSGSWAVTGLAFTIVPPAGTDTGMGTDVVSIQATEATFDVGTGADQALMALVVAGTDSGTGTDSGLISAAADLATDQGYGNDYPVVGITITDTAQGQDTGSQENVVLALDSGTGVDGYIPTYQLLDFGTGTEEVDMQYAPPADTGTGDDSQAVVSLALADGSGPITEDAEVAQCFSGLDAGSGDDEASGPNIQAWDSATGDDSSYAIDLLLVDQGTGTELVNGGPADTGTGTEDVLISLSATDSGMGADSCTLNLSIADTGTGGDLGTAPTVNDFGTGVDVVSALGFIVTDTGTGTDTYGDRGIAIFDQGLGVDVLSPGLGTSDSGVGADYANAGWIAIDLGTGTDEAVGSPILSDFGTGTDVAFVGAVTLSTADAGTGTEQTSTTASLAATDAGTGNDAAAQTAAVSSSDTASGADAISAMAMGLTDTGTGSDSASVPLATQQTVDAGSGSEIVSSQATMSAQDAAAGTDAAGISVSVTCLDAGTGADWSSGQGFTISDWGAGTDNGQVTAVAVTATDAGFGLDQAGVSAAIAYQDAGTGAESNLSQTTPIFLTDTAVGTDSCVPSYETLDFGWGQDAASIAVLVQDVFLGSDLAFLPPPTQDAGVFTDSAFVGIYAADWGAGFDVAAFGTAAYSAVDTGHCYGETWLVAATFATSENGTGVDSAIQAAGFTLLESAIGSDVATGPSVAVMAWDSGFGSDSISLAVATNIALDYGQGFDRARGCPAGVVFSRPFFLEG